MISTFVKSYNMTLSLRVRQKVVLLRWGLLIVLHVDTSTHIHTSYAHIDTCHIPSKTVKVHQGATTLMWEFMWSQTTPKPPPSAKPYYLLRENPDLHMYRDSPSNEIQTRCFH